MALVEPLAKSGENPITLSRHLQEVADYARAVAESYKQHWENLLGRELSEQITKALVLSALTHDFGKIAEGFQRSLQERKYRWEFRHEVLSAAILLASELPEDIKQLLVAAVLTHHRDLDDAQLRQDSGLVPIPTPELLEEEKDKFAKRVAELRTYWTWLTTWVNQQQIANLKLSTSPDSLTSPASFIEQLQQTVKDARVPNDHKALSLFLVRGWLMASDHAVSAGVKEFKAYLPKPNTPSLRKFQENLNHHLGHAFLEAPTGSGKTLAAILWALRNRQGGERIFYLLPYQASIEAMADTLEGYFGRENVAVLHARALDYALREYFEKLGEYEAAESYAKAEAELNRLVHKPIKVATPFQLLKWLFGIPRWEIGVSEMVGGLFVFDEIHAYDAHVVALIVEMVRFLRKLGGRFLFMSATFPPFLKQLLQEAVEAVEKGIAEFTLKPEDDWSKHFLPQSRHRLRWRDTTLEALLPEIVQAANEGKRVLVVANRVAQAREIYQALKEQIDGVHLLHSRFTRRDRVEKERGIIGSLQGKNELDLRILVSTQVVEVSLDVSFDTIFTEVAPVDDLLQRFGRVNRYGKHSGGVEVNVARQFDQERLKHVYDLERVETTLACAPESGTDLTVTISSDWVRKVYRSGWTTKERKRFEQAHKAFVTLLGELRPLKHLDEGREEFRGLFQGVEVLPNDLFQDFESYRQAKRYLLANQLLVPIPLGTFHVLNKAGRLKQLKDGTLLACVTYSCELGLLSEVSIDVAII